MKRKSYASSFGVMFVNVVLFLFSVTCIYPAVWLFYSSLKNKTEFYQNSIGLPKTPTFENFLEVISKSSFLIWMKNSAVNAVLSVALIILLSFVIGYFLSRFQFRGRNFLYVFFLFGIIIPIHALMIPMYILFYKLQLTNHWYTLLLPYTAFGMPIAIFLVESYVRSIPREMEEAAAIDGSSFSRTLFRIILPMTKPILTTVGIISFFSCWNEFSFSLILLSDSELMTVPVGMTLFNGQYVSNMPRVFAVTFCAMTPVMLIYFFLSKYIIKGMVTGAVKG